MLRLVKLLDLFRLPGPLCVWWPFSLPKARIFSMVENLNHIPVCSMSKSMEIWGKQDRKMTNLLSHISSTYIAFSLPGNSLSFVIEQWIKFQFLSFLINSAHTIIFLLAKQPLPTPLIHIFPLPETPLDEWKRKFSNYFCTKGTITIARWTPLSPPRKVNTLLPSRIMPSNNKRWGEPFHRNNSPHFT